MSEISSLFVSRFDAIEKEFDADDFARMNEPGCVLSALKPGETAKLITHAVRRMIAIGTSLGTVVIGEAYPRDPTRLRLVSTPEFVTLMYPNRQRANDYLIFDDLLFFFGTEASENIGLRLEDAFSHVMFKSTHNAAGKPFNVAADTVA